MKLTILAVALLGCVYGEDAPYAPSGTRPQGPLLVLPSRQASQRYGAPAQEPSFTVEPSVSLDRLSEAITEKLRQQEGALSGNYYIYLPDGRLQNVRYTSAPFKVSPSQNDQNVNVQNSQAFDNSNTLQFNQQNAQANNKRFQGQNFGALPSEDRPVFGQYRQPEPETQYSSSGAYSQQNVQTNNQRFQGYNLEAGQTESNPILSQYRQPEPEAQYIPSGAYSRQKQQQQASFREEASSGNAYGQSAAEFGKQSSRLTASSPKQLLQQQQYSEGAASNRYSESLPSNGFSQQPRQPQTVGSADTKEAVTADTKEAVTADTNLSQDALLEQQIQQQQLQQLQQQLQQQQQQWSSSYVASVHFADVQPIAAPIYSYAPAPLVRILRYAPKYL